MGNQKTSMTKCPVCGRGVSAAAAACPGCGHPICGGIAGGVNVKDPVHFIALVAIGLVGALIAVNIILAVVMAFVDR